MDELLVVVSVAVGLLVVVAVIDELLVGVSVAVGLPVMVAVAL